MTNAIITQIAYEAPQTAKGLMDAIAEAVTRIDFGGILIDSWSDVNNENRVFEITVNDSPGVKGKAYLHVSYVIAGSSLINYIRCYLFDSFNPSANHTGTNVSIVSESNPSTFHAFRLSSGQPIIINIISHPEIKLLHITQPSVQPAQVGIFRPSNVPSWWNEEKYLYAFMPMSAAGLLGYYPVSSTGNPLNSSGVAGIMSNSGMSSANPITNKRDYLEGLILMHPASAGIIAETSKDLIAVAGSGMNFGDEIEISIDGEARIYSLITPGGTPAIAIRKV